VNSSPPDPIRLEGFAPQDLYQKREKIFTRYVGGFFQRLRFYSGWPLLVGYFGIPWLMWDERQAVLFDLTARQFHLFHLTMWPQDFWLLGWLLMIAAFGLFTVTAIVGRLWCGYTCPQTIWTAIFMWAEQITEGSRHQRIRLDKAKLSWNKIWRRTAKHLLWFGVAALTGIAFVGYFVPIRDLYASMFGFEVPGWETFWILLFTFGTYVNAGWLREQVCLYMCPYARFQSAMVDKDTLIVSYDDARGEQRGSRKKTAKPSGLGDCIDCQLCVQVCPTGIDIRDGLQYECIGCAHCIDACNQVMGVMNYSPGLIRYATQHEMAGGVTHWLRAKSVGYGLVCAGMVVAFGIAILARSEFAFDILRERGELYRTDVSGLVFNDYQLKLMNKSQRVQSYNVSVQTPKFITMAQPLVLELPAGDIDNISLQLYSSEPGYGNVSVDLSVCKTNTQECVVETTTFFRPIPTS